MARALKKKSQIDQSKGIRLCLEILPRGHISPFHFSKINWLPVERRVELCTWTSVWHCIYHFAEQKNDKKSMSFFGLKRFISENYSENLFFSFCIYYNLLYFVCFFVCLILFWIIFPKILSYMLKKFPSNDWPLRWMILNYPCKRYGLHKECFTSCQ